MNSMIRGAPKGDFYMRANKVRNLLLIAVTGTALTLAGCGGRSVSSVDENDSTISSIASAASEDTMSEAGSLSGNGVIAAQEIDPSAVTPSVSGDSVSSNDSTDSSVSSNSSESTESTTEDSTGYTSAGVNMRSDADQDSDVVNTIEKGEEVKVLGTKDGWTHVEYDGDEGYVKSTYISSTRPSSDDEDDDDEDSSDEEYKSDDSSSDDDDEDYSSESSDDEDEDTESSSEEASD